MSSLHVGCVEFDISPRFHPTCGAWGTTSAMTELDMPLLAQCIAFQQDDRMLLWFGSDLVGETVPGTDVLRDEVAGALGLCREQVIWSTSQTHSSGAFPGSILTGSSISDLSKQDPDFMQAERKRVMNLYLEAGKEAIRRLKPAKVWAGRGYCDSVSYNTRFPMPNGGVKFSRHHAEGLQSGKPFDPTIGLVRFEDTNGKPLGAIFNFCAHPATMIMDKMISPDYVGTTRQYLEETIGGAPAMFCQGTCGDVNCYHIFGTPEQARQTGARLGKTAVEGMVTLIPARAEPFHFVYKTIELQCQPIPRREQFEAELTARQEFIDNLKTDPALTWVCGINLPEQFSPEQKIQIVRLQMECLKAGLQMLDRGKLPRTTLPITLGAVRIGDVAAFLTPGENFTETGMIIRARSPFVHTLICGDTNGLFGYIGTDQDIGRGGYETDSFWKMLYFGGVRLPPAKGSAGRIIETAIELLNKLQKICI